MTAATIVAAPVNGASSDTVVTAVVPSATQVDVGGCLPGPGGPVDLGVVQPGSSVVTGADCTVTFGSSNDSSSLRISQPDGVGSAMYSPTDGTLDADFGMGGFTELPDAAWSTTLSGAFAQDGSLYVVGRASGYNAIARLQLDGSKDLTFGVGGHALVDFGGAGNGQGETPDLFVLEDGSMLLTGAATVSGVSRGIVAKFTSAGVPDTSWSDDGLAFVPGSGGTPSRARHGMLMPDGGVLLAGASSGEAVTARFLADGSLDPAWGYGGVRIVSLAASVDANYGDAALHPDGGLVIAGDGATDMAALRLDAAGNVDTSFGTNGVGEAPIPGGNGSTAYAVGVQASGRIVMAGETYPSDVEFGAAALRADGTVDSTWGDSGTFMQDVGPYDAQGYGSRIGRDGRTYIAGHVLQDSWNTGGLLVLDVDGNPDTSFDDDGLADLVNPMPGGTEVMDVIESDHGIAVVAWGDYITWMFRNERVADYVDGVTDWNDGDAAFGACLRSAGTATPVWPTTGSCTATDGTNWRAVPPRATASGTVIASRATAGTSTTALRFGLRTAASQRPGNYTAPILLEVVAP